MYNKVTLIGNLGKDPDIRRLENGTPVANFSIATTESYKDTNGEWKDLTEWHNIVVWRGAAEYAEKYLKKGCKVFIEGKITTRKYTDKDGIERYTTEIVANICKSLEKKEGSMEQRQDTAPSVQKHKDDVFATNDSFAELPSIADEYKNKESGVVLTITHVGKGMIHYKLNGKEWKNTFQEWREKILPKVERVDGLPF